MRRDDMDELIKDFSKSVQAGDFEKSNNIIEKLLDDVSGGDGTERSSPSGRIMVRRGMVKTLFAYLRRLALSQTKINQRYEDMGLRLLGFLALRVPASLKDFYTCTDALVLILDCIKRSRLANRFDYIPALPCLLCLEALSKGSPKHLSAMADDELMSNKGFNLDELKYLLEFRRSYIGKRALIAMLEFAIKCQRFSRNLPLYSRAVFISIVKKMNTICLGGAQAYCVFEALFQGWDDQQKVELFGASDEIFDVVFDLIRDEGEKRRLRGIKLVELLSGHHRDLLVQKNYVCYLVAIINGEFSFHGPKDIEEVLAVMAYAKLSGDKNSVEMAIKEGLFSSLCDILSRYDNRIEYSSSYKSLVRSTLQSVRSGHVCAKDVIEFCPDVEDDYVSDADYFNHEFYSYDCYLDRQKKIDAKEKLAEEVKNDGQGSDPEEMEDSEDSFEEETESEEDSGDEPLSDDEEEDEVNVFEYDYDCYEKIVYGLLLEMLDTKQGILEAIENGLLAPYDKRDRDKKNKLDKLFGLQQVLKSLISMSEHVDLVQVFKESVSENPKVEAAYALACAVHPCRLHDVFIGQGLLEELLKIYGSDDCYISYFAREAADTLYLLAKRSAQYEGQRCFDKAFDIEWKDPLVKPPNVDQTSRDITLFVNGKSVTANKHALCSASSYFKELLTTSHTFKGSKENHLRLDNVNYEVFLAANHYIHHAELPNRCCDYRNSTFDITFITSLLGLADLFKMEDLKFLCSHAIRHALPYRPQYFMDVYASSCTHNAPSLTHSLILFACSNHSKLTDRIRGFSSFITTMLRPEIRKWYPSILPITPH